MSAIQAHPPRDTAQAAHKETTRMPHRLFRALDVLSSIAIVFLAAGTMAATVALGA